ncbi:AMIN domain-containing protein [bacterium]|nr:AMIN domain-containing protein [bacterium]
MNGIFRQTFFNKLLFSLFLGAVLLFLTAPVDAAYRVTDLQVSQTEKGVTVTVMADAPVSYSYFTMGEPEPRLVVDFSDAIHGLPKYHFRNLHTHLISEIRTSQYRPFPHPMVRVVLDMSKLLPFMIIKEENRLVIMLEATSKEEFAAQDPLQQESLQMSPETKDEAVQDTQIPVEEYGPFQVQAQAPMEQQPRPEESALAPARDEHETENEQESALTSTSPEDTIQSGEEFAGLDQQKETTVSRFFALGIREPVSYSSGGKRDPFVSLPMGQEVEFGQAPLPDVEKLTIVGILLDLDGYRALAQDEDKNAYVLRKGGRVLYGYVVRVEEERVVFRLNRRGLDKTIIIKLPQ